MATQTTESYTAVSSVTDLYEKTNTTFKTGIKLVTEEAKWYKDYPKENIKVSGNENRIPVLLSYPTGVAHIGDGGYEAQPNTNAPTHGTFMPVQMNARFSYTGLAQALTNRARAAMIEEQTAYQATQKAYAMGRSLGVTSYGSTTATVAVVKTTNGAGATQTGIALKNAFGSTSICAGTTTAQQTYLSSLFRNGEQVALVRVATVQDFGIVVASPSAGSGVGFVDITFNGSVTPTVADLLVFANAVTDTTLAGTDTNNWPVGWTDVLTAVTVHGVSNATYPAWTPGYSNTTGGIRFGFTLKEAMMNGVWNAAGVQMNRIILDQGVRRDTIAGERGALRYDNSEELDLEGELTGFKYLTSQLVPPGMAIGWYDQAYGKIELSDQPEAGMGRSAFKLDKVQDRSAMAAGYDYFHQNIITSRGATAYCTGLTSAP